MTIKICHVTSAHESHDIRIFQKECVSLAKNNEYEVNLVASGDSRCEKGVNVIGVKETYKSRWGRMFKFSSQIFNVAVDINADLYHLHDPELLKYALKLKRKGKIVIFDSHEDTYEQIRIKEYIPKFVREFVAKIYLKYETYVCKRIDAVVVADSEYKESFFDNRCKEKVFIDNTPKEDDVYNHFSGTESVNNVKVSCVGSLTEARGIENLIKACYLAGVKLILAGNFSPASFGERMMQLKEYECVDYRGYCNRQQVLEIFKETRIGASTILNIGQYDKCHNLPTKVYEYMAAGIPVVMNDFPFGRYQNDLHQFGILVNPDSPYEIAEAIKKLKDDETCLKYGMNGRKVAGQYFNWSIDEKKLFDLYNSLLKRKAE